MTHITYRNPPRPRRHRGVLAWGCLAVTLLAMATLLALVVALIAKWNTPLPTPAPPTGCQVSIDDVTTYLDHDQAHNAAIIVGESIRRELPPRAATIALVTAYQESKIYNLDYGDRDSIGLFQQRPSQGWGSVEEIMDPWYSSGKFYDHLVHVPDWENGVINDVAQAVQRSGFPEAYAKHEQKGRVWASALTGYSPATVTCVDRSESPANFEVLTDFYTRVFGSTLSWTIEENRMILHAPSPEVAWSAVQLAMLLGPEVGIESITAYDQTWTNSPTEYVPWQGGDPGDQIIITGRTG